MRCAESELDVSAVLLRMAYDSGRCSGKRTAAGDHIREFFIFKAQHAGFELAMDGCTFQALGKMAPVTGSRHGAFANMRAGRKNVCACADQQTARLEDKAESAHGAGLNDCQEFLSVFPGTQDNVFRCCLRKLA